MSTPALLRWQQKNYETLSQFLYAHNIPDNTSKVNNINKLNKNMFQWTKDLNAVLMKRSKPITLYRGIRSDRRIKNGELVNKAFIGTSKSIQKAAMYGDIIIKFTLPKHIKSYEFPERIGNNKLNEEEILIERNTKFFNIEFEKFWSVRINNKPIKLFIFSAQIKKFYQPQQKINNAAFFVRLKNLQQTGKFTNSNNESSNFSNLENE